MDFPDESSADPFASAGGAPAFDVKRLWATFTQFYWILILTLAVGLVGALVYVFSAPSVYLSTAVLKIERRAAVQSVSVTEGGMAYEGATTPEDLNTVEQSFISPMLMQRVIDRMDLTQRDDVVGPRRPASSVDNGELLGYLMGNCTVKLVEDTRLIHVSFQSWSPELAAEIANAIVEEGVEYDREKRIEAVSANVKFLQGEAAKLEANLKESEEKLNDYTEKVGIVSIDEATNIVEVQLRDLNSRHTAVQAEGLKLESDYEQIEACLGDPDELLDIESIRKVPAVERLYLRAGELRGQLVKLAQRYRPENPLMVQTQTELREVEKSLEEEVLQAPKSVEMALAAARLNERSIAAAEEIQEQKLIEVQKLAINYKVLQRQIEAYRMAYEATLKRLNGELSQARIQPVLLQVVQPAGWGWKTSVAPPKVLLAGLMIGAMAGFGAIFLIMQADSSIKSVDEAERIFRLSVLSAVPIHEPQSDEAGKGGGAAIPDRQGLLGKIVSAIRSQGPGTAPIGPADLQSSPAWADRYSAVAESFRTLRSSIQVLESNESCSLILITSALPAEGKSFSVLNSGVSMANSGQRTLLVDGNLRNPSLETRIFGSRGYRGLSDFLEGKADFSQVIRGTIVPNMDVVTAGSPHGQPGEILSRPSFQDFLKAARPNYDRIIFDSAPVTAVSDTMSIARFFPIVCFVFRAGKTPRRMVQRGVELLGRAGVTPFGLVMNFAPSGSQPAYGVPDMSRFKIESPAGSGFPITCPACKASFENFNALMEKSRPAEPVEGEPEKDVNQVTRICACGSPLQVARENCRDSSEAGLQRRFLFGELHDRMVEAGLPRSEARTRLLLTLKVWRNELYSEDSTDHSEAGLHRRNLFAQIVEHLVRSGLSREDAKNKLLRTIESWRSAP